MASHLRSHSTASSTGSLTDDLLFASYTPYSPASASPYPDLAPDAPSSRRSSASSAPPPPPLSPTPTATPSVAAGRSRARAFTFLGVPYADRLDSGPSPHTGETPFIGGAYEYALDGDDDEDHLATEMREVGGGGGPAGGGRGRPTAFRTSFQPLVGYELAWMGLSAAAVTGLTVAAVVLACIG
ncbi:hypothetical protein JCM3770_003237 [Rhodotorula araucariae]